MAPRLHLPVSPALLGRPLARAGPVARRHAPRRLAHTSPPPPTSSPAARWALGGLVGAVGAALVLQQSRASEPLQCDAERPKKQSKLSFTPTPEVDLDDASLPMRTRMVAHVKSLQACITTNLEQLEPEATFHSSYYLRDGNKGFGDSRVLQDGETFEKAGCNISVIRSTLSPAAVRQMRAERFDWWDGKSELPYFVAGCSLVVHPRNPHAPTIHFNYRYFEILDPADPEGPPKAWWFGGGTDLTPSYLYPDDAAHFHGLFKSACDRHDAGYYPRFKQWCDTYFFIPHRGESRGIGGIFFDDLADRDPEDLFRFIRDCSNTFLPAYYPLVAKRKDQEFSAHEKRWQQLRRGRYVEFNLVHDRGTKFGLAIPLTARWEYEPDVGTLAGSREKELMDVLKSPKEWAPVS